MPATEKCFSAPLIKTKLSALQLRAGLVTRPHLLSLLGESTVHPFTLVCAPAGYGKTTFITNWIADLKKVTNPDNPIVCWLSLDEEDNEPIRFPSYLVAAIEAEGAGVSGVARLMLNSNTPRLFRRS